MALTVMMEIGLERIVCDFGMLLRRKMCYEFKGWNLSITSFVLSHALDVGTVNWMIEYFVVVSFISLFSIVLLRKLVIWRYKLTHLSGTAIAYLVISFHALKGTKLTKKQGAVLFKCFHGSLMWEIFQWFFASRDDWGITNFPFFGLKSQCSESEKGVYIVFKVAESSLLLQPCLGMTSTMLIYYLSMFTSIDKAGLDFEEMMTRIF